MKLYGAYSLFNHFRYGQLKLYWYVTGREKALQLPYEELIFGYGPKIAADMDKARVEQCGFTEEEGQQEYNREHR
jgi:hypothetical protein